MLKKLKSYDVVVDIFNMGLLNNAFIILLLITAASCGKKANKLASQESAVERKDLNPLDNLSNSIVMFQDQISGKCFRLKNSQAFNGNIIELKNCVETDKAQQFYLTEGPDGSYKFSSAINRNFCLDNSNNSDLHLVVWTCHSDTYKDVRNQKVFVDEVSDKREITISFSNGIYTRIDGDNIGQTLDENSATVWKVLLQDIDKNIQEPKNRPAKNPRFNVINQMATNISIMCDETLLELSPNQTASCDDIVSVPQWKWNGKGNRFDNESFSTGLKQWCFDNMQMRIISYLRIKTKCLGRHL